MDPWKFVEDHFPIQPSGFRVPCQSAGEYRGASGAPSTRGNRTSSLRGREGLVARDVWTRMDRVDRVEVDNPLVWWRNIIVFQWPF